MTAQGLQVSTPTDTTIVLVRTFNAPRRLVWEAMLTPDRMRRWMLPPPGWTMTACACDARVGGSLRLAWKNDDDGSVMTLQGVFTEVVLHERITHTETFALGSGEIVGQLVETHEFTEKGGVTTMRITESYDSREARDAAFASGAGQGMEAGYVALDELLAQPA